MTLNLINLSSLPMPRKFLKGWVSAVEKELSKQKHKRLLKSAEMSIVFVNLRDSKKLNQTYRGRDYATDVLSFGQLNSGLSELVICPQVVRRQAKEHNLSFRAELAYMVLHGVLHLLGYEHEAGGSRAKEMYALQDHIFARLEALHSP